MSRRPWILALTFSGWIVSPAYRWYALPKLLHEVGGRVRAGLATEPARSPTSRCSWRPTSSPDTCPRSTSSMGATWKLTTASWWGSSARTGKSTLVKAMFGLLPPRSGTVRLAGLDITGKAAHELVSLGVGYVPQVSNVFPSLTVRENLEMGIYLAGGAGGPSRVRDPALPLLAERRSADGLPVGRRAPDGRHGVR